MHRKDQIRKCQRCLERRLPVTEMAFLVYCAGINFFRELSNADGEPLVSRSGSHVLPFMLVWSDAIKQRQRPGRKSGPGLGLSTHTLKA